MIILREKYNSHTLSLAKEGLTVGSIISPLIGAGIGNIISKNDINGSNKYVENRLKKISDLKNKVNYNLEKISNGEKTVYDKRELNETRRNLNKEEERLKNLSKEDRLREYNNHITSRGLQIGALTGGVGLLLRRKLK